jgi:hypothetical protein
MSSSSTDPVARIKKLEDTLTTYRTAAMWIFAAVVAISALTILPLMGAMKGQGIQAAKDQITDFRTNDLPILIRMTVIDELRTSAEQGAKDVRLLAQSRLEAEENRAKIAEFVASNETEINRLIFRFIRDHLKVDKVNVVAGNDTTNWEGSTMPAGRLPLIKKDSDAEVVDGANDKFGKTPLGSWVHVETGDGNSVLDGEKRVGAYLDGNTLKVGCLPPAGDKVLFIPVAVLSLDVDESDFRRPEEDLK